MSDPESPRDLALAPNTDSTPAAADSDDLALAEPAQRLPLDRHPVFVLLASKSSENSKRSYAQSFDKIAGPIGGWTGRHVEKEISHCSISFT